MTVLEPFINIPIHLLAYLPVVTVTARPAERWIFRAVFSGTVYDFPECLTVDPSIPSGHRRIGSHDSASRLVTMVRTSRGFAPFRVVRLQTIAPSETLLTLLSLCLSDIFSCITRYDASRFARRRRFVTFPSAQHGIVNSVTLRFQFTYTFHGIISLFMPMHVHSSNIIII